MNCGLRRGRDKFEQHYAETGEGRGLSCGKRNQELTRNPHPLATVPSGPLNLASEWRTTIPFWEIM